MSGPIPKRHHYIPIFYTASWAGVDGKLCQFYRHGKTISRKRKYPAAVGFRDHLYTIPGVSAEIGSALEKRFLQIADCEASDALRSMVAGVSPTNLPHRLRIGWTRFLLTLFHRNPQQIAWLGKVWATMHDEAIAETNSIMRARGSQEERLSQEALTLSLNLSRARMFQEIMDSSGVGEKIANLLWAVFPLNKSSLPLLTSDRPVVIVNGLEHPNGFICMAMGPKHLFLAANSPHIAVQFARRSDIGIARHFNTSLVSQAYEYVYAVDDRKAEFIRSIWPRGAPQFIAPAHLLKRFPPEEAK